MRELYFRYFKKVELERLNDLSISTHAMRLAVEALALRADMQLITELERVLQLLSNRDALWLDEEHIKTILLTLLYSPRPISSRANVK
ncbi:MAG: hypothetical protein R3E95_11000 [Thiolinea sp.]